MGYQAHIAGGEPEGPVPARRHRPQVAFRGHLPLDRYLLLHPDSLRYMKNRCGQVRRTAGAGSLRVPQPPDSRGLGYFTGF